MLRNRFEKKYFKESGNTYTFIHVYLCINRQTKKYPCVAWSTIRTVILLSKWLMCLTFLRSVHSHDFVFFRQQFEFLHIFTFIHTFCTITVIKYRNTQNKWKQEKTSLYVRATWIYRKTYWTKYKGVNVKATVLFLPWKNIRKTKNRFIQLYNYLYNIVIH